MDFSKGAKSQTLTPQLLLRAYASGLFPMAESAEDKRLFWVDPKERGVFPLDRLHISRSLAKVIKSDKFTISADRDFDGVLDGCANAPGRQKTWINAEIRRLYGELFALGHVHSIEAYADGDLVGGLYGVSLKAAFFGESMFSLAADASKVALAHLVARLRFGGFTLLDAQFLTPHLESSGRN